MRNFCEPWTNRWNLTFKKTIMTALDCPGKSPPNFFLKTLWAKQIRFLLMKWTNYVAEKKWRNSVFCGNSSGRFLHGLPLNFVVVYVVQGLHSIAVFKNTLSLCHKWFPLLVVSTTRKTYKLKKFLLARWRFCLPWMVKAWPWADNHAPLSQSECRKCNNYCPVFYNNRYHVRSLLTRYE